MKNEKIKKVFSFRAKLLFLIGASSFVLILGAATALFFTEFKVNQLAQENSAFIQIIDQLSDVKFVLNKSNQEWKNALIYGKTPEKLTEYMDAFKKTSESLITQADAIKPKLPLAVQPIASDFVEAEKKLIEKTTEAKGKFLTADNYKPAEAEAALDGYDKKANSLMNKLSDELADISQDRQKKSAAGLHQVFVTTILSMILLGFFAVVSSALFAKPLVKKFLQFSSNLMEQSDLVAGTSELISSTSTSLSEYAVKQASALHQTVTALEEIRAMLDKNIVNTNTSMDTANGSLDTIQLGKESLEKLLVSLNNISSGNQNLIEEVQKNTEEFQAVQNIIQEMASRTKVIETIVFQTKLLSFNASVEAARAGEHGKGFAVVAKLAQDTGKASSEISVMIDQSVKKVAEIARGSRARIDDLIAKSKSVLAEGNTNAKQCNEAFNSIMKDAGDLRTNLISITNSAKEQCSGVAEVTQAAQTLDEITQKTSVSAKEASEISGELSTAATSLRGMISEFDVIVKGNRFLKVFQKKKIKIDTPENLAEDKNFQHDHDIAA